MGMSRAPWKKEKWSGRDGRKTSTGVTAQPGEWKRLESTPVYLSRFRNQESDDPAVEQVDRPLGVGGDMSIVGHHQDRPPLLLQFDEELHDLLAGF
jgi:hypothetical protein